ncbi:MAG: hypothetical protein R3E89_15315 [Thiolinea sp.]
MAAEEKGKYAIAYHSDMSKYGAKAHLTAVTHRRKTTTSIRYNR